MATHSSILGLPYGSAVKESACNVGDLSSIPRLGRSSGEGKGYPLQYSGLENAMDCIIHGVVNSRTQLSDFHSTEPLLPKEIQGEVPASLWSQFLQVVKAAGKGNGTPLQYSCLENPMDGGAWWAAVHGVATEQLHFHFSLSCIGEGNGNSLQCSCLENPRDRGAWWAAVYGITQSQTRLK